MSTIKPVLYAGFAQLFLWLSVAAVCYGQDQGLPSQEAGSDATEGSHTIILSPGKTTPPKFLYSARSDATATITAQGIEQTLKLKFQVVQGKGSNLSLQLFGNGRVQAVAGDSVKSWAVRKSGNQRFLDIYIDEGESHAEVEVQLVNQWTSLPSVHAITNVGPGASIGFDSNLVVKFAAGITGSVERMDGFAKLDPQSSQFAFQTSSGGQLQLRLRRGEAAVRPIELMDTALSGTLVGKGEAVDFRLDTDVQVNEANSRIRILSGNVAISQLPDSPAYRLELSGSPADPAYELVFPAVGRYSINLDFVAALQSPDAGWKHMEFAVASGAVVPIRLQGFPEGLEFLSAGQALSPVLDGDVWQSYLPATGKVVMRWRSVRDAGDGKLFFSATSTVESTVGPGLLRQEHRLEYRVLQGELDSLRVQLDGPGEILDVEGAAILGWQVEEADDARYLDIALSQPLTGTSQLLIRSQTPMGAFPVRVDALTVKPVGALRYSGHIRLTNSGSVRTEPTNLVGLTQLAPEQFPGEAKAARQAFVYRFPSANYAFTIAADRIQPEVNITELVLYRLSESDRTITADIELDIREAAIREWSFGVPEDYSIVTVSGASVADYIAATEAADGIRTLKVVFGQDVQGRQLVSLHLEKTEPATPGDWILPRISFPDAKSVRGDIGIVGAPGFRITVGSSDLLVEKPLSYFPKSVPNLQQAFRIREREWSATLQIESLDRSIQSDVFHLYSLSQGMIYGSALVNYFVTGAPIAEWELNVPASLGNITVDGQDIRTWRREGDRLLVSLHQPVMGAYTLLITFEDKPNEVDGSFQAGVIAPLNVQGDRGYVQVVSPMLVELSTLLVSDQLLVLDPLELPAEFRLLSTAPALGTWQYTERPFDLSLSVSWFEPGTTASQVVEFSEANSHVSPDGELVTDVLYYVKSRGQRSLRIQLPSDEVRLWEVEVDGQPVNARQADSITFIPLPGEADPNTPVEVSLRLGKTATSPDRSTLTLPLVFAPVLKTLWNVTGDENHVLLPRGGTVDPSRPVLSSSGFEWIARHGLLPFCAMAVLALMSLVWRHKELHLRVVALACAGLAIAVSTSLAWSAVTVGNTASPLQLSLPVLAAGEQVSLEVQSVQVWLAPISWVGGGLVLGGLALLLLLLVTRHMLLRNLVRLVAGLLVATGILMHVNGAAWFFTLLAVLLLLGVVFPQIADLIALFKQRWRTNAERRASKSEDASAGGDASPAITSVIAFILASLVATGDNRVLAQDEGEANAASQLVQQWEINNARASLTAHGTMRFTGVPGDQWVMLQAPAVLTHFEGEGLRITKRLSAENQMEYVVSIPLEESGMNPATAEDASEDSGFEDDGREPTREPQPRDYVASFDYLLEAVKPSAGIPVLTGQSALNRLELEFDEVGWEVRCGVAARIEIDNQGADTTRANLLLGAGAAVVVLEPKSRDLTSEDTQFFVEGSQLYMPGPGVVDGIHKFQLRVARGRAERLTIQVPESLTVSTVAGPVRSWQFDADNQLLNLQLEPNASTRFEITIETQRGLGSLPADLELAPLRFQEADGEVGLVAVAFGPDAQPETIAAADMSQVNVGDFDASLVTSGALHRVFRYGQGAGSIDVRVIAVTPEVRAHSRQVLSVGDERIVLAINFAAEISRAGLFQLSFPLPDGLEVESLSGDALHHWTELSEGAQRTIVLHLAGKTIGPQQFAVTLAGQAPVDDQDWDIPRFLVNEAARQTGELVVRPSTGIRLRTVTRQNVSETDPRSLGGQAQGALAYRLLQKDWSLQLGIEKLAPWVTGQVLHEVTIREGQTRSNLMAEFQIQNASIRTLPIVLPIADAEELKTVRASGGTVSDFVQTDPDSNLWELRFKRRVIGSVQFQIEYERRGERQDNDESLVPIGFPDAKQLAYFYGIRSGGRLEIEAPELTQGWQRADWNMVPGTLREAGNQNAPALAIRAVSPTVPLGLNVIRHSLADALKLRVSEGVLTTVLSPTGDQLTSVDVAVEVIQRSSLSVQLPDQAELLSVFVNGESVHSIKQTAGVNEWQFYILPGMDDRRAHVRFVYSLIGDGLDRMNLSSPQLNVPLENVQWNVIAPAGFRMSDSDGNLEWIGADRRASYDRDSYLSKVAGRRQQQAQQAEQLLEQANQFLQAGEQTKARRALNSVANQYALDAASNEDARIQLENLQTQQAIVGLNTRRQRLYLDNSLGDVVAGQDEQFRQAAAGNPILQENQLNFRPQELSQLLAGNTSEDNAVLQRIAGRLVQHQRTTDPAPQAMIISMPEEGTMYSFSRGVQVAEGAPLELDLQFESVYRTKIWQWVLMGCMLMLTCSAIAFYSRPRAES